MNRRRESESNFMPGADPAAPPLLWYTQPDPKDYGLPSLPGGSSSVSNANVPNDQDYQQYLSTSAARMPPPIIHRIPISWEEAFGGGKHQQPLSSMGSQFQIGGNGSQEQQSTGVGVPQPAANHPPLYRDLGSYAPANNAQNSAVYHGQGINQQTAQPLKYRVSVGQSPQCNDGTLPTPLANVNNGDVGSYGDGDLLMMNPEPVQIPLPHKHEENLATPINFDKPCGTCKACKDKSNFMPQKEQQSPVQAHHLVRHQPTKKRPAGGDHAKNEGKSKQ